MIKGRNPGQNTQRNACRLVPCALAAAMETALATAAAGVPAGLTANGSPSHGLSEQQQPTQCARRALSHLAPGRLGLERSAALRSDLEALRRTDLAAVRAAEAAAEAGAPRVVGMAPAASPDGQSVAGESSKGMGPGSEAVASGVASGVGSAVGGGEGKGKRRKAAAGGGEGEAPEAGAMARSYAQQLARLGREAAEGETQQVRCWGTGRPRVLQRGVRWVDGLLHNETRVTKWDNAHGLSLALGFVHVPLSHLPQTRLQ